MLFVLCGCARDLHLATMAVGAHLVERVLLLHTADLVEVTVEDQPCEGLRVGWERAGWDGRAKRMEELDEKDARGGREGGTEKKRGSELKRARRGAARGGEREEEQREEESERKIARGRAARGGEREEGWRKGRSLR